MSLDKKLFSNKTIGNVLEEIYINSKKKDAQISSLINDLQPLVTEIGDATMIVPLIKQYLDVSVKNDEHLIKMAELAQKIVSAKEGGKGVQINDIMSQVMKDLEQSEEESKELDNIKNTKGKSK